MAQIKTFDDMLDCEPKLKLGELIQLFLLGDDDKIYINVKSSTKNIWKCYTDLFENVRIINTELVQYYDCYIKELADPCDHNTLLTIVIETEAADE